MARSNPTTRALERHGLTGNLPKMTAEQEAVMQAHVEAQRLPKTAGRIGEAPGRVAPKAPRAKRFVPERSPFRGAGGLMNMAGAVDMASQLKQETGPYTAKQRAANKRVKMPGGI